MLAGRCRRRPLPRPADAAPPVLDGEAAQLVFQAAPLHAFGQSQGRGRAGPGRSGLLERGVGRTTAARLLWPRGAA
eukprot:905490-Lingulodinium_polyedra.AAC.1